jgi:hypothetical protein
VNGRKKEVVREGSEEVNFSEQEEIIVSNSCSHGAEKEKLPFAAHACFIQGNIHRANIPCYSLAVFTATLTET